VTGSRQYAFPGDDLNAFDQAALQIFDLGFWIFDAILQVLGDRRSPLHLTWRRFEPLKRFGRFNR
jgi:hypothetical protein